MNKTFVSALILAASFHPLTRAEGLLIYKPPQTGAPALRIGGGTRGISLSMPKVQVLAPQHTALTGRSQPALYWYLSEPSQQTIEITLFKKGVEEPLLARELPPLSKAGLQSIYLSDYGVSLQEGEEYRWSVALIDNQGQRSEDVATSASLRYQSPATPLSGVERQAEAGYWYDALQQLIESHSPLADSLLKQIGISIPAL
jgi:hypothetical protein